MISRKWHWTFKIKYLLETFLEVYILRYEWKDVSITSHWSSLLQIILRETCRSFWPQTWNYLLFRSKYSELEIDQFPVTQEFSFWMKTTFNQPSSLLSTRSLVSRLSVSRRNVNSIRLKTDSKVAATGTMCERATRHGMRRVTLVPRNSKRPDAACFHLNRCESHNISLFGLNIPTWNRCLRLLPRDRSSRIV